MPTISEAFAIALQHHHGGRLPAAEQIYREILRADPLQPDAFHLLGLIAHQIGDHELAARHIEWAVGLNGNDSDYHYNLAKVYRALGRLPAAIGCYRRALELKPNFAAGHTDLGNALREQGCLEEALACCHRALEADPDFARAHNALGVVLSEQGKHDAAIACSRRALELQPDYHLAHVNLGLSLLLLGHYEEGWREYEHRIDDPAVRSRFPSPRWHGEPADGRTILIHNEQGCGDAIQFSRYVPLVHASARAQCVILETPPGLVRLFNQNGGWSAQVVPSVRSDEQALQRFDCHVPLLSLPFALRLSQPLPLGNCRLRSDPLLCRAWQDRLGATSKLRVGLAWAGNPQYKLDRLRSLPADEIKPLLQLPGIQFYSLQIGPDRNPPRTLRDAGLIDLTEHIQDFADTAALIAELDLIISVDTAVAHLAGAMGRPVWTLLPFAPDWRWGLITESTPWYPSMRLFRQRIPGDWSSVIQRIASELISPNQNR